jgi:hypothetical protein
MEKGSRIISTAEDFINRDFSKTERSAPKLDRVDEYDIQDYEQVTNYEPNSSALVGVKSSIPTESSLLTKYTGLENTHPSDIISHLELYGVNDPLILKITNEIKGKGFDSPLEIADYITAITKKTDLNTQQTLILQKLINELEGDEEVEPLDPKILELSLRNVNAERINLESDIVVLNEELLNLHITLEGLKDKYIKEVSSLKKHQEVTDNMQIGIVGFYSQEMDRVRDEHDINVAKLNLKIDKLTKKISELEKTKNVDLDLEQSKIDFLKRFIAKQNSNPVAALKESVIDPNSLSQNPESKPNLIKKKSEYVQPSFDEKIEIAQRLKLLDKSKPISAQGLDTAIKRLKNIKDRDLSQYLASQPAKPKLAEQDPDKGVPMPDPSAREFADVVLNGNEIFKVKERESWVDKNLPTFKPIVVPGLNAARKFASNFRKKK